MAGDVGFDTARDGRESLVFVRDRRASTLAEKRASSSDSGIVSAVVSSLAEGVSRQVPGDGDSASPARFNQLSPHEARFL